MNTGGVAWRKVVDFQHDFHSASMNICSIKNRRMGGDFTHTNASLSYTSLIGWINGQIPGSPRSFDGVF